MSAIPVCVFARPPRPGEVKTRLGRRLGAEAAAALAAAFLSDAWRTVSALPWARPVLAGTVADAGAYGLGPVEVWPQGEGDLGQRMERIALRGLAESAKVLLLGADLPGLPRVYLEAARVALNRHEVVLGPAVDGGFWLLGARRLVPGALDGIGWSRSTTHAQTRTALTRHGLDVGEGPRWFDVDEPEDLERVRALVARFPRRAPRTHEALAQGGDHSNRSTAPDPVSLSEVEGQRIGGSSGPSTPLGLNGDGATRPSTHQLSRLAIIVPVLNEVRVITQGLAELELLDAEVLVVDGGSLDGTRELVEARAPRVRLLTAPKGRATQLNAGAAATTADVLLFLHADVSLPPGALEHVHRALEDPKVVAGAFRTWTVADRPTRLGPLLHLADLRSRYSTLPYGDQALFVRAEVFRRVGGFPPLPLMEDLALSQRLAREGRVRVVPSSVRVSGRRFIEHPVRDTFFVNVFPALFRLGVPAEWLARRYQNVR